jgi:hypothetical protein
MGEKLVSDTTMPCFSTHATSGRKRSNKKQSSTTSGSKVQISE